jgi:hypothetical protein
MKLKFVEDVLNGRFKLQATRDSYIKTLTTMEYLRYSELTKIKSTKTGTDDSD